MAAQDDHTVGTITLTSGLTTFTTVGASLQSYGIRAGDAIIAKGSYLVIASITGQEAGTLAVAAPVTAAGTQPLRIRFQPDASRLNASVAALRETLADGKLASFAALTGAADKMPYLTGAHTMALTGFTAPARTLLAQTTQALMRSTGLGLGTMATQNADAVAITGGSATLASANVSDILTFGFASSPGSIEIEGNLIIGKGGVAALATPGIQAISVGELSSTAAGFAPLVLNRISSDGTIVNLMQTQISQGTISISGSTTSYNSFAGSHWSQLSDNSRPDILRGTVVETIDEMCDWLGLEFTDHDGAAQTVDGGAPAGAVPGDIVDYSYERKISVEETTSEDVLEDVTEPVEVEEIERVNDRMVLRRKTVAKPLFEQAPVFYANGKPVLMTAGDGTRVQRTARVPLRMLVTRAVPRVVEKTVIETVRATVVRYANDQLPKFKVSDTPASPRVYGVFMTWDADDDDRNDALITGLGAFLVRIDAGAAVKGGDLLESAGNGCARVQADDVIRTSTIGKVTSPAVIETYPDGSYTVPVTLYCG